MKRILITGATGVIGRHSITPLLEQGYEVYCTSTKERSDTHVSFIKANLLHTTEIKKIIDFIKPEYLLHFAWIASGDYLTSDLNYKWLESSLVLLREFKKNGGKRVVFAGTCFEYKFKNTSLNEDDELNPTTIYANCKNDLRIKAELYCKENKLSFGWGRIFFVFGEGEYEKRLYPSVMKALNNDEKIIIKSGKLVRDYMSAKDVANAFVQFLTTNIDGCVNICSGKGISIKNFVTCIAKKKNKEHLVEFIDNCDEQPQMIVGDNTRLQSEARFISKYTIDDIIRIT